MTRAGSGVLGKALLSPDPHARSRIAYRSPALRQRLAVGLLRAALRNHRLLSGRRATLSRLVRDPRARNRQELDGLSRLRPPDPARPLWPCASQPLAAAPKSARDARADDRARRGDARRAPGRKEGG